MRLNVYVPKPDRLPQIQPGVGIIGTDRHDNPMRILVDYEDNRSGAVNIRIMWNHVCQGRRRP
jgi:hypothetical protein